MRLARLQTIIIMHNVTNRAAGYMHGSSSLFLHVTRVVFEFFVAYPDSPPGWSTSQHHLRSYSPVSTPNTSRNSIDSIERIFWTFFDFYPFFYQPRISLHWYRKKLALLALKIIDIGKDRILEDTTIDFSDFTVIWASLGIPVPLFAYEPPVLSSKAE